MQSVDNHMYVVNGFENIFQSLSKNSKKISCLILSHSKKKFTFY